mmetsp:Transcript_46125/g.123593  ORF Transcript_46125/g.123593 Transcript_46125/m.123593 type:complete len:233 (+) Transcript_46125:1-699(+)
MHSHVLGLCFRLVWSAAAASAYLPTRTLLGPSAGSLGRREAMVDELPRCRRQSLVGALEDARQAPDVGAASVHSLRHERGLASVALSKGLPQLGRSPGRRIGRPAAGIPALLPRAQKISVAAPDDIRLVAGPPRSGGEAAPACQGEGASEGVALAFHRLSRLLGMPILPAPPAPPSQQLLPPIRLLHRGPATAGQALAHDGVRARRVVAAATKSSLNNTLLAVHGHCIAEAR